MSIIENELKRVAGYLIGIYRDPLNGWYEIEVGIQKSWVYESNKDIVCEDIGHESDKGKVIIIKPIKSGVTVDDLINYLGTIIKINFDIQKKEEEFIEEMKKLEKTLESRKNAFYDELNSLKELSFKGNIKPDTDSKNVSDVSDKGRGRPPKNRLKTDSTTNSKTNNVIVIKTDDE